MLNVFGRGFDSRHLHQPSRLPREIAFVCKRLKLRLASQGIDKKKAVRQSFSVGGLVQSVCMDVQQLASEAQASEANLLKSERIATMLMHLA